MTRRVLALLAVVLVLPATMARAATGHSGAVSDADRSGPVHRVGGDERGSVQPSGGDERGSVQPSGGDERGSVQPFAGGVTGGVQPFAGGVTSGVQRLAGDERAATAAAMAVDAWDTADTVVIVDGWDPVAALVGAHLAGRLDVPVLVSGAALPAATADAVQALGTHDVVVVGTATVHDDLVEGEVTRVTGADPPALAAAAVRLEPGATDLPVVLASQATFADALAAANLAPARLLFTDPQELSAATAAVLEEIAPSQVVLVGGEAALAPAVAEAAVDRGHDVHRVAGPDRYATAVAAAAAGSGPVVLASGQTFADAVAIVPWAARVGAAVLLTTRADLPEFTQAWLEGSGRSVAVIAGGTAAVGNFVDRQAGAALAAAPRPGFEGGIRSLTAAEREAMTGASWREGCPVGLEELRLLEVAHFDLTDNVVDDGRLVVHADHAEDVLWVMGALFDARFSLERVRPVEEYGGDDDRSMAANNTHGFNCRFVGGTTRWSEHAFGAAVDLNPVQNPFVRGSTVEPSAGRHFVDRADVRPGMIVRPGPVTDAFAAIGWGWGADFSTSDDYQHFSANGR